MPAAPSTAPIVNSTLKSHAAARKAKPATETDEEKESRLKNDRLFECLVNSLVKTCSEISVLSSGFMDIAKSLAQRAPPQHAIAPQYAYVPHVPAPQLDPSANQFVQIPLTPSRQIQLAHDGAQLDDFQLQSL